MKIFFLRKMHVLKNHIENLILCMVDKNKEVKILGEKLFIIMINYVRINTFILISKKFKPIVYEQLMPLFNKNTGREEKSKKRKTSLKNSRSVDKDKLFNSQTSKSSSFNFGIEYKDDVLKCTENEFSYLITILKN